MSRDDLISIEGKVTKQLGGGISEIECDASGLQSNGAKGESKLIITAILSGKMKKNRIRVLPGDRVRVNVSPYDTTHGLIVRRL